MSDLDLYADLSTGKLTSRDGGAPILPALVLGDVLRCTLRTLTRIEGGELRERILPVRTLTASLGPVMAVPTAGEFTLTVEGVEAGPFNPATTIADFLAAVHAAEPVAESSLGAPGCWLISFVETAEVALLAETNTLQPESLIRIRDFQQSGRRWYEVRLIQAPLAFNEAGHERVLPPEPSIREVRAGAAATDSAPEINELQDMTFPATFRGTYFLRWNFRATRILGIEDGPDEIADALNGMWKDGAKRFAVANVEADHEFIEFIGPLGGAPQSEIEVEVSSFPPGVLTFALPLDRANLAAALRAVAKIEVPLEVELEIVEDGLDPENPAIPGRLVTLFQQTFTVVREQKWKELATVQPINWLHPPAPRNYIPFTPDQVIVGQANYTAVIGDGVALEWALAYNLGTRNIAAITVQENATPGRVLGPQTEYAAVFTSDDELVLTFAVAPALNSLAVVIASAGPISAFLAHTHTMEQIVGLLDALADLNARVADLETLLPGGTLTRPESEGTPQEIVIPDAAFIFPNARLPRDFDASKLDAKAALALPRPPGLLPAVHDATITDFATGILPAPTAGNVYRNTGAAAVPIPGALGRRSTFLAVNAFAGHDGRAWYRVTRDGASNSFFPTDFELELFPPVYLDAAAWKAGQRLTIEFDLAVQLLRATSHAQYVVVIETGTAPSQATPSPVTGNLENVVWRATPLLAQRLIVTPLAQTRHFGCEIKRSLTDVITAEKLIQQAWTAADDTPVSPSFVLRARLIRFDTENSINTAVGYVTAALTEAEAAIL